MTTTPQNLAQGFAQFQLEQATQALQKHSLVIPLQDWPLPDRCRCGWRPRRGWSLARHQAAMAMVAMGLATAEPTSD